MIEFVKYFLPILLALNLVACSGAPEKKPQQPVEQTIASPEAMPGTATWSGLALELPRDSPVVMHARLDELVSGLREFKDWVTAEPKMLGENGEDLIQRINLYWSVASTYLGADPADPKAWSAQGLDVERSLYVGAYATNEATEDYVEAIREALRNALQVETDTELLENLKVRAETGSIPVGINSVVSRAVEGMHPDAGMRILVPTTDVTSLLELLNNLANGAGYIEISIRDEDRISLGALGRAYYHLEGALPAFSVRMRTGHIVIDVVWPPASSGDAGSPDGPDQTALDALRRGFRETPSGRPAAPAAVGDPSLSIGIDQERAATLVAARGFKQTLEFLELVDTSKRDQILALGAIDALANSRAWATRATELTGLNYSVDVPGDVPGQEAVSLDMAIYGHPLEEPLSVDPVTRGLELDARSGAAAVDLDPFYAPAWVKWLRLDSPAETLDMLDASEADPFFHILALPRNLALLVGNLAQQEPATFEPSTALVLKVLPNVRRFEFATVGPTKRDFARQPKFVVLASLRQEDTPSDRQFAATGLLNFTHGLALGFRDVDSGQPAFGAVTPDTTITTDSSGQPFTYHYTSKGDAPFILIGAGIEGDEFEQELERVGVKEATTERIAYARLEPISIVAILAGEENAIKPVDPAILAQRLGIISAVVDPETTEDAQILRFRIELSRPPRL